MQLEFSAVLWFSMPVLCHLHISEIPAASSEPALSGCVSTERELDSLLCTPWVFGKSQGQRIIEQTLSVASEPFGNNLQVDLKLGRLEDLLEELGRE